MSQSFTFIDAGGYQAQYTISEKDRNDEFFWSTDHGDRGIAPTYAQAQDRARNFLKASMATRRKFAREPRPR